MKNYKRLTEKAIGCFGYDLKDFEHKPKEFNDYDAFYAYKMAVKRLGELEDKIESGEIDYVADRGKQIARLTAENAELRATLSKMETVEKELRARLDNAVELSYSYLEMLKLLACASKCYANLNCNSTRGFDEIKNATDAFKDCLAEAEACLAELKGEKK